MSMRLLSDPVCWTVVRAGAGETVCGLAATVVEPSDEKIGASGARDKRTLPVPRRGREAGSAARSR